MFRQWLTLVIIVLVYIPVAIDATVLHVAAPTLSMTLGASGNELLWIIDIYSLVMAGMVLPMGALGDRIGFKRLLMLGGTLFGLASLAAAFSHTASWLIATRVLLAIGAAMIVPATLAGIRATFCEEKHRNMALGVWAAVGSGGAAFGPLIGGILLEHFYWGSVFLINVPIVLVVMGLTARYVPRDHIDGLADPKAYLARLRQEVGPACYITVEKILAKGEQLPDDWPVSGTTGYEFIASLAEVLVDDEQIDNLRQAYETVKGAPVDMRAELRAAKLLMVDRNFEGEFTRLLALALSIASELQIAQEESIVRQALRELLIAFPVYRTYGTAEGLPPTDICLLHRIVERVKTLENPPQPEALTFLSRLLTGDVPASSQEEATQFRVRFQQLTGPLMAKSVEDTLFFRQNMGLALNEVGAEPVTHHFSIERFHHEMKTRQARQPDALSGTSTHDTKRGEDARARLYTLTEAPEQWSECLARWRQMNQTHVKFLNDGTAPKSADTWMLYQALTGVWPPMLQPQDETGLNALKIRFEAFVEKALREAKLRTDWVDSNEAYETAMLDYARYLLAPDNQTFLQDFYRSLQPFIRAGLVNSLTQTVIKLTAPGVPDIYQGSEALNFSLVDPDNRREPDFATLAQQLDQLTPGVFSREESWLNGQVNQYVTAALLRLRQQNHELFRFGDYIPLRAVGQRADKVIAYARVNHDDALIVVAPRLVFAECDGLLSQSHSGFWSGTDIIIPGQLNQHRYRNVLTQERLMPGERLSLASHQGGVLVLMSD